MSTLYKLTYEQKSIKVSVKQKVSTMALKSIKLINDCRTVRRRRKKFEDFAREMAFKIEMINPARFGCAIYGAKDKVLEIL